MTQENLLTKHELATVLGVSSRTVARMKHDGLPYVPVKMGYKQEIHKFDLAAVKKWIAEKTVEGGEHLKGEKP